MRKIRSIAKQLLEQNFPFVYWKLKVRKMLGGKKIDEELLLLPILCNNNKIFIDIGAAGGLYSVNALPHSQSCIMFEPIPAAANELRALCKYSSSRLAVEEVAVSDRSGTASFRIVEKDAGRSTLEKENHLDVTNGGEVIETIVTVKKLDEYGYDDVGLIKIDVEGHEVAVLDGAIETLRSNTPNIIIEIEERHNHESFHKVRYLLENLGYIGFFMLDKTLNPISTFDFEKYQNVTNIGDVTNNYQRKGVYVNNFIFVPANYATEFCNRVEALMKNMG